MTASTWACSGCCSVRLAERFLADRGVKSDSEFNTLVPCFWNALSLLASYWHLMSNWSDNDFALRCCDISCSMVLSMSLSVDPSKTSKAQDTPREWGAVLALNEYVTLTSGKSPNFLASSRETASLMTSRSKVDRLDGAILDPLSHL